MTTVAMGDNVNEYRNLDWEFIPEPVLLAVLRLLDVQSVIVCSRVCKRWNGIAADNLLWKFVLRRDFKIRANKLDISNPEVINTCFKSEYRRLIETPPSVNVQTLSEHTDEVLHVTFSHDGQQVSTCSKDCNFIVWNMDESGRFSVHYKQHMGVFGWIHTWASQFSPKDTKLSVSGVVNEVGGELAIFKTGRGSNEQYTFLCRVINDPYDILGCWLDDRFFLAGTMSANFIADVEALIWLCEPPEDSDLASGVLGPVELEFPTLECYKGLLYKFKNVGRAVYLRYVQCHSRLHLGPYEVGADTGRAWDDDELRMEQRVGDEEAEKSLVDQKLCTVFLCGDKTSIPHQLGFQSIHLESLRRPPTLTKPERAIDFQGHVIGMALSNDGNLLYVNVRSWPEDAIPRHDQPPPIATNIDLRVVDLRTLELKDDILTGHYGYTPSEKAFYLYLDAADDFIGSGSEDSFGYVWERRYGVLVARLAHAACVNCVAFNPLDEETCLTASDDNTLQVWVSKRRIRQQGPKKEETDR